MNKPRYSQQATIRQQIDQQIQAGMLSSGEKLPSERELSALFDTSRITVKDALSVLESEGLIYREERRGWYVASQRLNYNPLFRCHFHQMVSDQQRLARTELLSVVSAPARQELLEAMELSPLTKIQHIHRLRYLDDRPVLYVENCLVAELFPEILKEDLTGSLTNIYASRFKFQTSRSRFEVLPTAAKGPIAKSLNLAEGHMVLKIRRVNYNQFDQVIDCECEYWRHDAVQISIDSRDHERFNA